MKPISPFIQYSIGTIALISVLLGLRSGLPVSVWPAGNAPTRAVINSFAAVVIEAKAALIYEPDTGRVLYAKNEREPLPIASLTKIMTALAASQLLPDSTVIALSRRHYQLKDLVALTLISSSNRGALALATATQAAVGRDLVAEMNTEAKLLGLNQTTFANSTGLDLPNGQAGSRSSASDIAHLFTYVLTVRPELLTATKFEEIEAPTVEGLRHRFENTNEIIRQLPGLLASKTGFTDNAEGSLVIAFDRGLNQPIIIAVLGSTEQGRFSDVKRLVEATIEAFLTPA